MALTRTNIIGRITLPDDTNPVNSVVRFVMTGFDTDDTENATIIQIPIDAPIDALGDIDVDLWPNPLGVRTTFYSTYARIPDGNTNDVISIYLGQISVPSTNGPYDLNDLLPISPPAGATVSDYIAQLAAAVASTEANATTAVISAAQAALYDGVWLDDVPAIIADTSLTYTLAQPGTVAENDYINLRSGFNYQVAAAAATDNHIVTDGGVKLYVKQNASGPTDIRAFGATGIAGDDQDAAAQAADASNLPIFIPADFVLEYSTPLNLRAPWTGSGKGQGLPGSVTDVATKIDTSELRFTGTGWAVTTRGTFQNIALRSDGVAIGQNGIKFIGASMGQIAGPVRVMEFDGTGIEIGGSVEESGIYFADISALEINNNVRLGTLGMLVIGGGVASSNANTFTGTFVSGPWETYLEVQGHNNTFLNCDVNPKPSAVAALGGTLDAGVVVGGDGNTFINPYFEPTANDPFDCLVRFEATSSSNKFDRIYSPSLGGSPYSLIQDFGTSNEITFIHIGENFTPSIGVSYSEDNVLQNPALRSVNSTTVPYSWVVGGGSTGVLTVDPTVKFSNNNAVKFSTSGTRYQIQSYVLSASSLAARNTTIFEQLPKLAGQTVSMGVWCLSSVPELGSIKAVVGATALGNASHSGSGQWEFLTIRTRVPTDCLELALTLRNQAAFGNTTGDCWFSDPCLVLGHDVPKYAGSRKLDATHTAMYGSMSWNPPAALPIDDATPSVSSASLFVEANTVATTITNFDDGRNGQEIIILVTSANTTLANTGTIKTTTGAAKALAANRAYRLVKSGTAWWEVG